MRWESKCRLPIFEDKNRYWKYVERCEKKNKLKVCTKCGIRKAFGSFYVIKYKTGYRAKSECKECSRARVAGSFKISKKNGKGAIKARKKHLLNNDHVT